MDFFNFLTGKRYWYSVELRYLSKDNELIFSGRRRIGVIKQADILDDRDTKKLFHEFIVNPKLKRYLCSGIFDVYITCYLGKFKEPAEKTTNKIKSLEDIIFPLLWAHTLNLDRMDR